MKKLLAINIVVLLSACAAPTIQRMESPIIEKISINEVLAIKPASYQGGDDVTLAGAAVTAILIPGAVGPLTAGMGSPDSPMSKKTQALLNSANIDIPKSLKLSLISELQRLNIARSVGDDKSGHEVRLVLGSYGLSTSIVEEGVFPYITVDYEIRDNKYKLFKRSGNWYESKTLLSFDNWENNKEMLVKEFNELVHNAITQVVYDISNENGYSSESY